MLCAIATDMAGLINSINPSIKVRGAAHLFDLAWLYGVDLILPLVLLFLDQLCLIACGSQDCLLCAFYIIPCILS
jgi:hypothetical protein